jgi:hypothetical protein
MVAELILAPEAAQDIAEAYAWYEGYRVGLGEEFLSCVEACLAGIRRNPGIHSVVHGCAAPNRQGQTRCIMSSAGRRQDGIFSVLSYNFRIAKASLSRRVQ